MSQLPHDNHAWFCFLTPFVSLVLFSWAFLFTIGYLPFLVLPFGDMSLCWFSSRLYVSLPMGYGSSLIFYRLGCCGAIGFGLCLFSFLLMSLPGVSPVLIPGLQFQRQHLACTFWFICWLAPSTLWGPPGEPRLLRAPPCFTVLMTFFPMTMRYLELAISLFGASVHFCLCSFLRPKFFCSTKYMHFSVADHIKHVVRSAAYIQYRTSSHIHHGLQRIALSLMFLRNSVRLQCSAERYCTRVYYFVVHWLLLELLRMSH